MKILIPDRHENPANILRQAGYAFKYRENNEMSFVRTFGRAEFPRFHCYAKETSDGILVNIHLDVKRETYGEDTRHHGEYGNDGPLKEEVGRLLRFFGKDSRII